MFYLESLNERQKEAVLAVDGPLLILAGAGAGKTKTITHRILHLIKQGNAPQSILAITFTNKAAREMRERVDKLLSGDKELNAPISFYERPFVSTFHALGVHILKENAELLGIPRHFAIFDKGDSKRAIKEAIESAGFDPKQLEPSKVQNIISKEKGNFISFREYAENAGKEYVSRAVSEVWEKYEAILKREKALDFDDLLLKTAKLLHNNKEVRERYQNIWKYIHIDEYQDTNRVQYQISRLLAEKNRNICVVGDPDQNIYSWRGAEIRNILDFEKDYTDAKVILLEENYRSTQTILSVANTIIKKNKYRKEKNLFTKNVAGDKISLFEGYDEASEAGFVAKKCKELEKSGVSPKEIAVLFRANFQSRALEEAFLNEGVAYQMLGTKFFERKEVKDMLSFIRASLNPDSLSDVKRIINIPARGIGKVTLLKIFEGKEESLPPAMRQKVANFRNILKRIAEAVKKEKPSELVKFVIKESGIENTFDIKNEEDMERLENVRELATMAVRYDQYEPEEGTEKMLADASLASDQDTLEKEENSVKLMTVHASKGLEFDYIFVTGLEENLFPHKRLGDAEASGEESEEERRLFYVALTRARKKVFLSYAQVRTIFGSRQVNIQSEFLMDIEDEFLEKEMVGGDDTPKKPLFSIEF